MPDTILDQLLPRCDVLVDRRTHGPVVPLTRRRGVMVHYDDSASDRGALAWFRDPAFKLSYNRAYRDDGTRIRITPSIHHAAWHAGVCTIESGLPLERLAGHDFQYGGANTGYFGLSVTANGRDRVTPEQLDALMIDTAILCRACGWGPEDVEVRIVGHHEKAIFNPRDNPTRPDLWRKVGRKIDPVGMNAADPVVNMMQLREGVRSLLYDTSHAIWSGWPS